MENTVISASQLLKSSLQHMSFKWYKLHSTELLPLSTIFVHKFKIFSLLMYNRIYIWKASTSCVVLMAQKFSLESRALQVLEIYSNVVLFTVLLCTNCSRGSDTWPFLSYVLPIGYCPMLCYMAACYVTFSVLSKCYPCAI